MRASSATGRDRPVLVVLAAGMAKRYGGCKPLAPVGLHGEAVLDVIVSDALAAGFGDVVLVLGTQSGPAITYHVRQCWPAAVEVSLALQPLPLGTTHAALCARPYVGERPFAVVNADDVYGVSALELLVTRLASPGQPHTVGAYHLRDTVVTDDPVTRGTVVVDAQGNLTALVERRHVARLEGDEFRADDRRSPGVLPGDTLVSMNLWAFTAAIWPVLATAVLTVHPAVSPADGSVEGAVTSDAEVLLPETIGTAVATSADGGVTVRVLPVPGRCIGVTHADDLPVVRTALAVMIGQGERAEGLWGAVP